MEFRLTPEQEQFRDTVRRIVDSAQIAPDGLTSESYAEIWRRFGELGVAGLCVVEEQGGFSGAPEDIALVAMEMGRSPTVAPRIEAAAGAAFVLGKSGTALARECLQRLVAGDCCPAIAFTEGRGPGGAEIVRTRAVAVADGFQLTGKKIAVVGGAMANLLLVTAMLPDNRIGLFAVDPSTAGIKCDSYRLADMTLVADVLLTVVQVREAALILSGNTALEVMEEAFDVATMTLCASSVGGMEKSIELTIEYLKMRNQFGHPLANFQALQHQIADMFMLATNARSSLFAAIAALKGPPRDRRIAVSGCKITVSAAAKEVTGRSVHLHGGIGFTTEYAVGHLFRRAVVDEQLFGGTEFHLERRIDERRRNAGNTPCLAVA